MFGPSRQSGIYPSGFGPARAVAGISDYTGDADKARLCRMLARKLGDVQVSPHEIPGDIARSRPSSPSCVLQADSDTVVEDVAKAVVGAYRDAERASSGRSSRGGSGWNRSVASGGPLDLAGANAFADAVRTPTRGHE